MVSNLGLLHCHGIMYSPYHYNIGIRIASNQHPYYYKIFHRTTRCRLHIKQHPIHSIQSSIPITLSTSLSNSKQNIPNKETNSSYLLHPDLRVAIRKYIYSYLQFQPLTTSAVLGSNPSVFVKDASMSRFSFDTYRLVRQLERQVCSYSLLL